MHWHDVVHFKLAAAAARLATGLFLQVPRFQAQPVLPAALPAEKLRRLQRAG
jgi:hypothetical protein